MSTDGRTNIWLDTYGNVLFSETRGNPDAYVLVFTTNQIWKKAYVLQVYIYVCKTGSQIQKAASKETCLDKEE